MVAENNLAERLRLEALRSYRLDEPLPDSLLNHVVGVARRAFGVADALVTFVGADRTTIGAGCRSSLSDVPRPHSFCAAAIEMDDILVVPDASLDERFKESPLVSAQPCIRFYAGAPLVTHEGHRLGCVCLVDAVPRASLDGEQRTILRGLADMVMERLETRRREATSRAAMRMAAAVPDAIVGSDARGLITFWNPAAERIFGLTRGQALFTPLTRLVPPSHRAGHRAWMDDLLSGRTAQKPAQILEVTALRGDGSEFPIEISTTTWRGGDTVHVGSIIRDVSDRHRAHERMRVLTHFDRLTGLPNRVQFLERIDAALMAGDDFTVIKAGIDRFKAINGTAGMAVGDLLLEAAAREIVEVAGAGVLVARLAGDEFGVLLQGTDDVAGAENLCRLLVQRFRKPFHLAGSVCRVGISTGIVVSPGISVHPTGDCVLKAALLALQNAKRAGGDAHCVFRPELGRQADERLLLEEELREAFVRGEFELHFQPQVLIPSQELVGAEALLRWRHPERGLLPPSMFLPVLETSDIAVDVGRWIIREACAFAACMTAGGTPLRMGVNLFAAQLRDPGLFDVVAGALAASGLSARLLELEITETTVLGLDDTTIEPLRRLHGLGVGIAFDDYGTGYASLSLLKRYPLTRLKIDREFVRDLETDPDDAAIVRAVLALGTSLGLDVIAEGIETPAQAIALVGFGCREAQGYLFGRPMAADDFAASHGAQELRRRA